MSPNHYHILGVTTTATALEIKQAYKRLALRYHPDRHRGDTRFEEQFKQVSVAYGILSDPARRASYDHGLRQDALRADAARRQQQFRAQGQRVYGVPMPAAQPLRTRRPASSAERHYRPIPKRRTRFTRRDYWLMLVVAGLFILFGLSVKVTMDHLTALSNYDDGLQAYGQRRWSVAHAYFSEAVHFKPEFSAARRRRGEIEQLVFHDYSNALTDYQVALREPASVRQAAELWWRVGQCQTEQGHMDRALRSYTQAIRLDSTLADPWLGRGELRMFEQRQFRAAIRDLSMGLRQRAAQGKSPSVRYQTYRGLAWFKLREYDAAREDYQQVLLNNPQNGQIHFLLGRLAQEQGKPVAACEFYARAVLLGYSYAEEARLKSGCQ